MLRINGVSKSYDRGATWAVKNLSLHVQRGEIFGFLGPNGAGKTTTLRMIVGLLPIDEGEILVDGYDVTKDPIQAKRRIGFLPDSPNIYDRLSGLEYVRFIADIYGVPEKQRIERTQRLLEMFEMTEAAGDLIKSYSHGMRQKIALTAALVHQPPLLILDEPMVGLDPRSSALFRRTMREHCDAGGTVLFSTHVLEVAERICDRVGIINKGVLIAHGTMDELRKDQDSDADLEALFFQLTETNIDETP
ncbi:MAG: ABC transporter ATP-binding protein [Firmicutes bacterium]|jgi:ABC-2 type transport system ATP-binding protein|nr:ABC transporter ATP-binding protein [Bacillota bacterium]